MAKSGPPKFSFATFHSVLGERLPKLNPKSPKDANFLAAAVVFRACVPEKHKQGVLASISAGFAHIRKDKSPYANMMRSQLYRLRAGVYYTKYPAASA